MTTHPSDTDAPSACLRGPQTPETGSGVLGDGYAVCEPVQWPIRDHELTELTLTALTAAARRVLGPTAGHPAGLTLTRAAHCHPHRPLIARGLCRPCYETHWQNGTLDQYAAKRDYRRRAEFLHDYKFMAAHGYTDAEIATRMGMTRSGLAQAKRRARKAGEL